LNPEETAFRPRAAPWVTAAVALAAVAIRFLPNVSQDLILDRRGILSGQLWRLWTGHLVHFGPSHLFWNLAVFAVAGAWVEGMAPRRTRLFFLLGPPFISLVLISLEPDLLQYGGLSGLAAGALALLSWVNLESGDSNRFFWRCLLLLVGAKIIIEILLSAPVFARFPDQTIRDVPLAHIAGVAAAAFALGRRPRL
jgi:rhomboid family GlyGly-CTERM serine protease